MNILCNQNSIPKTKLPIMALTAVCSLFFSTQIFAQNTFTLKDNELDNSPNLSIGGTVFGADLYDLNLAFVVEGKLCYRFKKEKAWLKANFTYAFADRLEAVTESDQSYDAIPAKGTQALKDVGASFGFNFIKRVDIQLAKASFHFLNRSRNSGVTIPIKKQRLYGLHTGYEKFRTVLASGSTISYTGTITEGSLKGKTIEISNATPMMHMNIISFGIHRQRLEHYELQVNTDGEITEYVNKKTSTVYADFLIGTNILLDDLAVPFNQYAPNSNQPQSSGSNQGAFNFYKADINNSYKRIPIGGRIGWESTVLKPFGALVGAEFGFRPGIFTPLDNLYISMKIGFMLNFKAK